WCASFPAGPAIGSISALSCSRYIFSVARLDHTCAAGWFHAGVRRRELAILTGWQCAGNGICRKSPREWANAAKPCIRCHQFLPKILKERVLSISANSTAAQNALPPPTGRTWHRRGSQAKPRDKIAIRGLDAGSNTQGDIGSA